MCPAYRAFPVVRPIRFTFAATISCPPDARRCSRRVKLGLKSFLSDIFLPGIAIMSFRRNSTFFLPSSFMAIFFLGSMLAVSSSYCPLHQAVGGIRRLARLPGRCCFRLRGVGQSSEPLCEISHPGRWLRRHCTIRRCSVGAGPASCCDAAVGVDPVQSRDTQPIAAPSRNSPSMRTFHGCRCLQPRIRTGDCG